MLTTNDINVVEKVMRKVVKDAVGEAVKQELKEELKPLNEFASGATDTLFHILDELQKTHNQKLDDRVNKLESIHPDNQHIAAVSI